VKAAALAAANCCHCFRPDRGKRPSAAAAFGSAHGFKGVCNCIYGQARVYNFHGESGELRHPLLPVCTAAHDSGRLCYRYEKCCCVLGVVWSTAYVMVLPCLLRRLLKASFSNISIKQPAEIGNILK